MNESSAVVQHKEAVPEPERDGAFSSDHVHPGTGQDGEGVDLK
jgi:hypothetical protein